MRPDQSTEVFGLLPKESSLKKIVIIKPLAHISREFGDRSFVIILAVGFLEIRVQPLLRRKHSDPNIDSLKFLRHRSLASYASAGSQLLSTIGSSSSSDGLIIAGFSSSPVTASCVFSPLPVMQSTISSSRGIRPCSIS